jgi:hypothetical protein
MESSQYQVQIKEWLGSLEEKAKRLRMELEAVEEERQKLLSALGAFESEKRNRRPRRLKAMTLKEAVVEILVQAGHGLTASEILHELNSRHGTDFERESLSPQISRLKNEGTLALSGKNWHLIGQPARAGESAKN